MSFGHFSSQVEAGTWEDSAMNSGNGDVPSTGAPGPEPYAGLTKELRGFKGAPGNQFPVLPEAGPSVL